MDDQPDAAQLAREFASFCQYHANPPSFETWKARRAQHEAPNSMSVYRRLTAQGVPVPKPKN